MQNEGASPSNAVPIAVQPSSPTSPAPLNQQPLLTSSPRPVASPGFSSAAITQPPTSPSFNHSFMFQQPTPGGPVSLESISNQIFALSQCVMQLSLKVSDNQRLFDENLRLKDIVIDLEFKLKDANERIKSIDVLKDTMTAQFAELQKNLASCTMNNGSLSAMERQDEGQYEDILNITNTEEPLQSTELRPEAGTLNLQNREMTVIPDDVYKLNDPELLKNVVGESDDLKWWETEPISKLYLCSNKISTITPAISGLNSLTLLDLRDNSLTSLPEEISQLEALTRLELSHNKLTSLPNALGPSLQHLSLNNNVLSELPPAIETLSNLQTLDLRVNNITVLPALPSTLQSLAVDDNKLSSLVLENHPSLNAISANSNVLNHLRVGNMPQLKVLSVRINKLAVLEPLIGCPVLNEVLVGKNFLTTLDFVLPTGNTLTVLDCSDNKITLLPADITKMTNLKRLDVSNNDIGALPPQLSQMDNLTSLSVDGNPLRTIRREIIAKGTVAIKEYLQLKLDPAELEQSGPTIPDVVPDEKMSQTRTLEVDRTPTVDTALWDQALVCGIVRLSMQHSQLSVVPEQVFNLRNTLKELELAGNNLRELSPEIGKMGNLRKLNLSNNFLKELPGEMSDMLALEDLNLSHNKLDCIPECLHNLPALCSLILSNNQINKVEPAKLMNLTMLQCLDLENNSIGRLPPELSMLPSIRTLLVMGNTFKIPRADVLSKGSTEVLAWLKNKVPR